MMNQTVYIKITNNELYHYGTKGHSGRYPWGSGDRPYQRLGYRALSKDQRKLLSKQEKYRRKEVDKADRTYGSEADRYQKKIDKYNEKADRFLEKGNSEKEQKFREKAHVAQVGKDMCNALLEKDLAKISVMDVSEDKKAKGRETLKTAAIAATMSAAVTAVALPTTGMFMIPVVTGNSYNRLKADDIEDAYNSVRSKHQDHFDKREAKEMRRAIERTTQKKSPVAAAAAAGASMYVNQQKAQEQRRQNEQKAWDYIHNMGKDDDDRRRRYHGYH